MRPHSLPVFGLLFLVSILAKTGTGQEFTDPAVYNNYIIAEQNKVVAISLLYIANSVHGTDLAAIEASRQDVIRPSHPWPSLPL
ncbi:MAG: hypothetical protein AAGB22_13535 [Bacteroidota bacterium]